jgi:hypothetical protein
MASQKVHLSRSGAGLRFNPAPLDKKLPSWDAGMKPLRFEWENLLEKHLTG